VRGVLEAGAVEADTGALLAKIVPGLDPILEELLSMRAREGAALEALLNGHLDEIERLTEAADVAAEARRPETALWRIPTAWTRRGWRRNLPCWPSKAM